MHVVTRDQSIPSCDMGVHYTPQPELVTRYLTLNIGELSKEERRKGRRGNAFLMWGSMVGSSHQCKSNPKDPYSQPEPIIPVTSEIC